MTNDLTSNNYTRRDIEMMRRAIQLAQYGAGRTKSNPMVGCVICNGDGKIIGEGWHRKYGEGHAEVNAVNSVKESDRHLLKESTVYVTLEPCSHYGKTPPCARLLTEIHPGRIVVGTLDPFPAVSGRGVEMLRDAGISVDVGVLEEECRAINPRFLTAHSSGRPYILLKWAQSSDGFIDTPAGQPRAMLSTPSTSRLVHRIRAQYDAIFVGTSTVIMDNPSLDTRLWPGDSPTPATFDSVRLPIDANILRKKHILRKRDEDLHAFLQRIYSEEKITSMIVEGGSETLREYLQEELFDEIRIETSPILLHSGTPAPRLSQFKNNITLLDTIQIDGNLIQTFIKSPEN